MGAEGNDPAAEARGGAGGEDRVVGDAVEVDYDHTRRFFENRAARAGEVSDAQVTTFQDKEPGLAERREGAERAKVLPLLDLHLGCRVLDLGCGSGRWAWPLVGEIGAYLGVDFSAGLIQLAQAEATRRGLEDVCRFETMSLVDLEPAALPLAPPFDRVLVVGVLMYVNDDDVDRILGQLDGLVGPTGRLYLTEPIGRTDRLTLVDHQSDELADTYSAIYRTRADYEERFARLLPDLTCIDAGPLYPPELENRAETQQFSWVFTRDR
jgi:cyclopropane fatty-acyl-phospholipid synthase-like methyltransferase